jgi:hypothetical protein
MLPMLVGGFLLGLLDPAANCRLGQVQTPADVGEALALGLAEPDHVSPELVRERPACAALLPIRRKANAISARRT